MQPQNSGDPNAQYSPDPQTVGPPPIPVDQPIYDNLGNPVERTGLPQDNPYAQQFAEELAAENPPEPTPPPKPPKKSGPKKLIVSLVFALLFAGLIGGGVAAFTQYQKPERVAEDMLTHLLAAKYLQMDIDTDISFDKSIQKEMDIEIKNLNVSSRTADASNQLEATLSVSYADKDFDLKGAAIVDETGDVYFRLQDIQSQVEKSVDADFGAVLSEKTKNDLKKLEKKWIRYSVDQMKKDMPDFAAAYTCQLETLAKLSDDVAYREEVIAAYRMHPVLRTVGSAQYDGMMVGYEVEIDEAAYGRFNDSLQNTDFGESIRECAEKTAPLQPVDEDSEELEATAAEEAAAVAGDTHMTQQAAPETETETDGPSSKDAATDDDTLEAEDIVKTAFDRYIPEDLKESEGKVTASATIWVDMISHELKQVNATVDYGGVVSGTGTARFGHDQQMAVDTPSDSTDMKDWLKQLDTVNQAVDEDVDKTRTKKSQAEIDASKTVYMIAEQVRLRAEAFSNKFGQLPENADQLQSAELDLPTESPRIVSTLPREAGSVAYKRCSVGAQVVYRDINRNKYVAKGLGGVSSGDITALCA